MKKFVYVAMAFTPVLALAQGLGGLTDLAADLLTLLNSLIPVLFALALIYFFWGLIKFIRSAGDPKAASEGKSIMIYGVIALVVMVGIYGVINWIVATAALDTTTAPTLPTVTTTV